MWPQCSYYIYDKHKIIDLASFISTDYTLHAIPALNIGFVFQMQNTYNFSWFRSEFHRFLWKNFVHRFKQGLQKEKKANLLVNKNTCCYDRNIILIQALSEMEAILRLPHSGILAGSSLHAWPLHIFSYETYQKNVPLGKLLSRTDGNNGHTVHEEICRMIRVNRILMREKEPRWPWDGAPDFEARVLSNATMWSLSLSAVLLMYHIKTINKQHLFDKLMIPFKGFVEYVSVNAYVSMTH